jgi:hypothetical protein
MRVNDSSALAYATGSVLRVNGLGARDLFGGGDLVLYRIWPRDLVKED